MCVWRIKTCNLAKDLFIGEHVCEESDAERERADHVAYQFNTEYQRRQRYREQYWQPGPGKMRQMIEEPILMNADIVVVNERRYRQSVSNIDRAGRSPKNGT